LLQLRTLAAQAVQLCTGTAAHPGKPPCRYGAEAGRCEALLALTPPHPPHALRRQAPPPALAVTRLDDHRRDPGCLCAAAGRTWLREGGDAGDCRGGRCRA